MLLLVDIAAFHQFTRVGDFAMIGGGSVGNKDIPPYFMASGIMQKHKASIQLALNVVVLIVKQ